MADITFFLGILHFQNGPRNESLPLWFGVHRSNLLCYSNIVLVRELGSFCFGGLCFKTFILQHERFKD